MLELNYLALRLTNMKNHHGKKLFWKMLKVLRTHSKANTEHRSYQAILYKGKWGAGFRSVGGRGRV